METRKLTELTPNPLNPRGAIVTDDSIEELATSIKSVGLLQPLVVNAAGVIIAGHRRFAAANLAGLSEVAVVIRDVSEIQQIAIMLAENIQRQALNPVQEGRAYLQLIERGLTIHKISKAVGIGSDALTLRVTVARMPAEAQVPFAEGKLPVGCAKCLQGLEPAEQLSWVLKAVENEWTGAELSSHVQGAIEPTKNSPTIILAPTKHEQNITKLTSCQERLEQIDKDLDDFNDLRGAQTAIRQAVSRIVESMLARAKQNRAA